MAIVYTNECVGCEGLYPCPGDCSLTHVPHFECDKCGDETDKLYWYDGDQLCEDCLLSMFEEVNIEDGI